MSSVEIAYDFSTSYGQSYFEWILSVLCKRDVCPTRPRLIRLGRKAFDYTLREMISRSAAQPFCSDEFALWSIQCKLDWSLPNESIALEFYEGAQ